MIIFKALKFIVASILAVFYWPINLLFRTFKTNYFIWKKEDRFAFIIATPLYVIFVLITTIFSRTIEALGEAIHPPLDGFR
ncbi:MAG: hypothetical protein WCO65_01620 [bacterium]